MSQIANIAVYDGADTPILHTLLPVEVTSEKGVTQSVWRENIPTLPTEAQVVSSLKKKTLPSGVVVVAFKTAVPVMESVSGANASGYTAAPKVAYVDTMETVSYQHPRSTSISRRTTRMLHTNMMNAIGISVAATLDGPIPEAIDGQFLPN